MHILANPETYKDKEALYIHVRDKEGRVISDEVLKQLPDVQAGNPYKTEWDIRAANFERFKSYLAKRFANKQLNILDVGCGNGWMTHRLYEAGHKVMGADLNLTELQQAESVFGSNNNLQWAYADVLTDKFTVAEFDVILFAASCQYFPDIEILTQKLKPMLVKGGEIHFVDSIFYTDPVSAKERSLNYYTNLGFPAMTSYYHHHATRALKNAGYKKLYPGLFSRSILQWWRYAN